jgi:hypothetical protein
MSSPTFVVAVAPTNTIGAFDNTTAIRHRVCAAAFRNLPALALPLYNDRE